MNNLSQKMQERLDKWRQRTPEVSVEKQVIPSASMRRGRNDGGDAMTKEDWDKEAKLSQTRK